MNDRQPNRPGGNDKKSGGPGGQRRRGAGRPQGGKPRTGQGAKQANQQTPIEIAVRSTRNAMRRHAEGLRNDQVRLGCRGVLMALHGNLGAASNPGEILGMIEQVGHVLHGGDDAQLPVALRAVVSFVLVEPRRTRDVQEQLRLLLRHLYAMSSDYIPRAVRDDARFRGTALIDVLHEAAREYLSDEKFQELRA